MKVHYPPTRLARLYDISIFLAGSIELDKAENWQQRTIKELNQYCIDIFNPRRLTWDASWPQSVNFLPFCEQVDWELDYLSDADIKLFYFDPNTKSPVTLLELGVCCVNSASQMVVCCPETFWRAGNVEIVCKRYNVKLIRTFDAMIFEVIRRIKEHEVKQLEKDWSIISNGIQ